MLTIVAVHGNGGGGERFARAAGAMPAGTRLVTPTLPGFSTRPRDPSLRTVADYADHLAGELQTVTDGDGVAPVLLGHGIGGSIALDLVSRRPDAARGLILHAPVGAHLDTRLFPKLMSTGPARALVRRAISSPLARPLWRRLFFPHGAPKVVLDEFFEAYRHCAVFGDMFDLITAAWFDGLAPVHDVPVVLLWGAEDRVLRRGQADAVGAKVPGAEVLVRDGWDHFPMIEQPEEYADAIATIARRLVAG
jgi:pimeloyl-ACP methyl ester carboxylesterase